MDDQLTTEATSPARQRWHRPVVQRLDLATITAGGLNAGDVEDVNSYVES